MKIHFLITKDFFRGGGIETYTREVGRRLASRGHEVTVYSTRGKDKCVGEWEGMRFIWLPSIKPHWAEKTVGVLVAAYKTLRESPDILHLHSVVAGSLSPLLRFKGAPCIVQMHGIEWLRNRWGRAAKAVLKAMERTSLGSADAITAVSQTQCEYFKRHYDLDCEYISTAADIKDFASPKLICEMGIQPRKYVLFAARLVPEKGAHYLIEAFRRLSTDYSLIIAGEAPASGGYGQQLLDLAKGDERIRFLGRVQGRLLEELFSNAALFAQPSELEGLSIGLIEGMSYGTPCLASDIPENREVVGDAGLLFRNKDVDDLERRLDWVLSNIGATAELAARGRQRVQELFTWERVVDQLEALYARVYDAQRHPVLETVSGPKGKFLIS
ncbi:MAG TPA: glycosyltransferase family 4 protein [Bryobacteraceae bacterium]|nr:glycosyltransferase family 4 protein [Bryobacteraceae bacterium]